MNAPTKTPSAKILGICQYLQSQSDTDINLNTLSKKFSLSPHYLQRKFKAEMGISPKQYLDGVRLKSLKTQLKTGRTVTDALYDVGYSSSSRVYEKASATMGMTPAQYQKGGAGMEISYAGCATQLGQLLLAATSRGLCFIQFGSSQRALRQQLTTEFSEATIEPMGKENQALFQQWMLSLNNYINGDASALALPMDLQGTAFQVKVWTYLQQIPYGEIRTYADVAKGVGKPKAVRAVGTACGANRLALAIPCHRVIRGDGTLGGYRWGLDRKQHLLDQEASTDR